LFYSGQVPPAASVIEVGTCSLKSSCDNIVHN